MILKASQRAGANALASHLLNDRDNEHVHLYELRGFAADDLHGALTEAFAISRGTKCKQFMFSMSVNPPKGVLTGEEDLVRAIDQAEQRLGLVGQPRAIVIHEKEGRRHAHVVWSRIDADAMRAVNMPHFKRKLTDLSRELFLEHGWNLPEGLRRFGGKSPLNFSLEEWQQAKRQGRDPREIKDALRDAWAHSDNADALRHALEERGYFLARGDRRGAVVIDTDGEVFSLARWAGVKARDIEARVDGAVLPSVIDVQRDLQTRTSRQLQEFVSDVRVRQAREILEARAPLARLAASHRKERQRLVAGQRERWEAENRERANRLRTGLKGLWDTMTGRKAATVKENETEAIKSLTRDAAQRDALATAQLAQRRPYQFDLDRTRKRHEQERRLLARTIMEHRQRLKRDLDTSEHERTQNHLRERKRGALSLDL